MDDKQCKKVEVLLFVCLLFVCLFVCLFICLIDLILNVPVKNISVTSGRVFLD